MSVMPPFNRAEEFPNYFELMLQDILNSMPNNISDEEREAKKEILLEKIQLLIEQNISAILHRLELRYVDERGFRSTDNYFGKLAEKMREVLKKYPVIEKNCDLHVYLSGGVVRTLLSYVYKQLYIHIQETMFQKTVQQKSASGEQKQTSEQTTVEKLTLAQKALQAAKIFGFDKAKIEREIDIKQQELEKAGLKEGCLLKHNVEVMKHALDYTELFDNDAEKMQKNILEIKEKIDRDAAKTFNFFKDINTKSEFWLQKLKAHEPRVDGFYVLGVGSDMDVLYELKPKNNRTLTPEQLSNIKNIEEAMRDIEEAGTTFLNSAATLLNLPCIKSDIEKSLFPPADISPYHTQIKRAMLESGGCTLDWLAFELSPPKGTQELEEPPKDAQKLLVEPPEHLCKAIGLEGSIIKRFIQGSYRYVIKKEGAKPVYSDIQLVRAIRPLFETPFLKCEDEDTLLAELEQINDKQKNPAENDLLSEKAIEQVNKLQRNANFEGAHNRAHRADTESQVLSQFLEITQKLPVEGGMPYLPKYLQAYKYMNRGQVSGFYDKEVADFLIDMQTFIETYTNSGTLYHGTPRNAVSPIIRGGFLISGTGQGAAVFGSGLYTTKDKEVALSYCKTESSVFSLHLDQDRCYRIIDLDNLPSTLLENLAKEAKERKFFDVNELLKIAYHIDVVINEHVIIQNAALIKPIVMSDLVEVQGLAFQQKFMKKQALDNEVFSLIDIKGKNWEDMNNMFMQYIDLCLLFDELEQNPLSPSKIIRQLLKTVRKIDDKKQCSTLKTKETRLFIYMHCFLADISDLCQYLPEIIQCTNDVKVDFNLACNDGSAVSKKITQAFLKFIKRFAAKARQPDAETTAQLTEILRALVLYANSNDIIVATLEALKSVGDKILSEAFQSLIAFEKVTKDQAMYFLAKIKDEDLRNQYATLFDLKELELLKTFSAVRTLSMDKIHVEYPKMISEHINMQDSQGNTYFMQICRTGTDVDIDRVLQEENIDLTLCNNANKTALSFAILNKSVTDECIIRMIDRFPKILDAVCGDLEALSSCISKRTILSKHLQKTYRRYFMTQIIWPDDLLFLAVSERWDAVRFLLQQEDIDLNIRIRDHRFLRLLEKYQPNICVQWPLTIGEAVFFLAAETGQWSIVQNLIEQHKMDPNTKDCYGNTVLLLAIEAKQKEIVEFLVGHSADVNVGNFNKILRWKRKKMLETTQQIGIQNELEDEYLGNGENVIFLAARTGQWDIVRVLVQQPGIALNKIGYTGDTVVMLAAKAGQWDTVRVLAQQPDIALNETDPTGDTVVMLAAKAGQWDTVRVLAKSGADLNRENWLNDGDTVASLAVKAGKLDIMSLALESLSTQEAKAARERALTYSAAPLVVVHYDATCEDQRKKNEQQNNPKCEDHQKKNEQQNNPNTLQPKNAVEAVSRIS